MIGNVLYRTKQANAFSVSASYLSDMVAVAKILRMPKRSNKDLEKDANAPLYFSLPAVEEEQAFAAKVDGWLEISDRLLGNDKTKKMA